MSIIMGAIDRFLRKYNITISIFTFLIMSWKYKYNRLLNNITFVYLFYKKYFFSVSSIY